MNSLNYIAGLLLVSGGKFCNLDAFLQHVDPYFSPFPFGKSAALESLDKAIQRLSLGENEGVGQQKALALLVADDLKMARNTLLGLDEFGNPIEVLSKDFEGLKYEFSNLGFDLNDVKLFIVDEYPKPYDKLSGAALSPDKSDSAKYGIEPGLYFRKSRLAPIQSSLTLAHELTHQLIGRTAPELLARGLEEGLCDFYGLCLVGSRKWGNNTVRNFFVHRRLKFSKHVQRFKLYMDYFRQATYLYNTFGTEGLIALIKGGRRRIKEVERMCINMELDQIDLPKGGWDEAFYAFVNHIALCFPENEVVSPLAFYLAQEIREGDDFSHLIKRCGAQEMEGVAALKELQNRIYGIFYDDDRIEYSDMSTILKESSFRYEI